MKAGLHNHCDTSFLDGRARPSEMAAQAVANGDDAIAITDHDEVGGQIAFQEACKAAGIKDVKGTEARWLYDVASSKEAKTKGSDASHIVLLAENDKGLANMWALSSIAYEKDYFYQKPNLTPDLMRQYSEGLWASDGCGLTRFADFVEKGDEDQAKMEWLVLLDIFGDRFYSELHTFQIIDAVTEKDKALNTRIKYMNHAKIRFAEEMGVPLVVVNDAHYAQKDQWEEHRLVWDMNTYKGDQTEEKGQAADWLMNADEISYWLDKQGICNSVAAEAMKNSGWIAEQCNVEIKPHLHMPRLHANDAEDREAFLRACEEGFRRHIVDRGLDEGAYLDRLQYEGELICEQGMAGYFNVVADYVNKARSGEYARYIGQTEADPCICGPGRGSAGGSLVTYVLGITSLDPIKYDLMFERFINPDRPDKPDIDVDVQKSHRLGIKDYIANQYRTTNVCSIGTRSRSGPKQSVTDIAKALGDIPWKDIKEMAALIGQVDKSDENDYEINPDFVPPTWTETLEEVGGELKQHAKDHPKLFKMMDTMVGLARQSGVHAAGIIINTEPLLGNVPTRRKPGGTGTLATQFDMHEIEDLGGVKLDLLSNNGLDVLAIARKLIWERHAVWLDYDGFGNGVPKGCENTIVFGDEQYNDPRIYEQIDRGQTAGIFQIHTASGTKQAMRFKPRSLTDIADLAAINRPGVLRVPGLLEHYLRRRHGEEEVVYDHPMLEPITGPGSSMNTHGILVYQEQLIRCAREIAGFDAGEAEALRKAIGKKLMDKMIAMEPKFISGCLANKAFTSQHGNERIARKLWSSLLASGAYAFNKSHATGYAMQPCWELWTKCYYFDEFIVACLAVHTDKDKTLRFIRECRQRNRPVLAPDVNLSAARFSLSDDGIRFGLTDIKGIGDSPMKDIIGNRPYTSLADYLARTAKSKGRKKGVVDALVRIGAFDAIEGPFVREDMLECVYDHRCREALSTGAPVRWGKNTPEQCDAEVAEYRAKAPGRDLEAVKAQIAKKKRKSLSDVPMTFAEKSFPPYTEMTDLEHEMDLVSTFIAVDPMARYAAMIEGECIRHPLDMDDYSVGERFAIGGEIVKMNKYMQRDDREMAFLTVQWAGEDFDICAFADAWAANKPFLALGAPVACDVLKLAKRGSRSGCQLSHVERLDWLLEEKNRCQ